MVHCWVICLLQLPSPVLLDVHRWCIGLPYCTAALLCQPALFSESVKGCRV